MNGQIRPIASGRILVLAARSAAVGAVAVVVGLITLGMFFALGEPWGTINDVASILIAVSALPVVFVLYNMNRVYLFGISLIILMLTTISLLLAALLQVLLIVRLITFADTSIVVPAGFGVFGLALMVYTYGCWVEGLIPRGLVALGFVAGAGYVLTIAGFLLGGPNHPLTALGGVTAGICYPLWALLFARFLLSGRAKHTQRPERPGGHP